MYLPTIALAIISFSPVLGVPGRRVLISQLCYPESYVQKAVHNTVLCVSSSRSRPLPFSALDLCFGVESMKLVEFPVLVRLR